MKNDKIENLSAADLADIDGGGYLMSVMGATGSYVGGLAGGPAGALAGGIIGSSLGWAIENLPDGSFGGGAGTFDYPSA